MLPLLERTETSVCRRFFYGQLSRVQQVRVFLLGTTSNPYVTNVNHGGHVIFFITLLRGPPEKLNVSAALDAHSTSEMGQNANCRPAA